MIGPVYIKACLFKTKIYDDMASCLTSIHHVINIQLQKRDHNLSLLQATCYQNSMYIHIPFYCDTLNISTDGKPQCDVKTHNKKYLQRDAQ